METTITRRRKFQAKPSFGGLKPKAPQPQQQSPLPKHVAPQDAAGRSLPQAPDADVAHKSPVPESAPVVTPLIVSPPQSPTPILRSPLGSPSSSRSSVSFGQKDKVVMIEHASRATNPLSVDVNNVPTERATTSGILTPVRSRNPSMSSHPHRRRTLSTASAVSNFSTISQRRKRRFEKDEELDPKKFTMADLVDWTPSTENTLKKKWDEKRQQMLEQMSNASVRDGSAEPQQRREDPAAPVPKVRINERGELVIDEESLVMSQAPAEHSIWETVDEDLVPKRLSSTSFRKKPLPRQVTWSDTETDMFYAVLSATGPDFGLMQEFMPHRTRAELKKKFTKEERQHLARVNETLSKPSMLDDTLYTRVEQMLQRVEQEQREKEAKRKRRESVGSASVCSIQRCEVLKAKQLEARKAAQSSKASANETATTSDAKAIANEDEEKLTEKAGDKAQEKTPRKRTKKKPEESSTESVQKRAQKILKETAREVRRQEASTSGKNATRALDGGATTQRKKPQAPNVAAAAQLKNQK